MKERGISALDHAARFFHIKPGLTAMRNNINEGIQADEKAISSIEAVSAEYHEAGRHVKNIGRALMGKEAVQEAKAPGKLAKTVQAPIGRNGPVSLRPGTVWIRRLPVLNGWNVPPKDSLLS